MTPDAMEATPLERMLASLDTAVALCLAAIPVLAAWWLLTASRPAEAVPYAMATVPLVPAAVLFAIAGVWMRRAYPRRWLMQALAVAVPLCIAAVFTIVR